MAAVPGTAETADLRPATVEAFQRYVQTVEARIDERVAGGKNFLWMDDAPARRVRVGQGEVVTERAAGKNPVNVPDGLIHDFIGAVFIRGVTLGQTLAFVQDYGRHGTFYGPEVLDSRIISREGEHFVVFMRLKKKKVITVVLDTEHDAWYFPLDRSRWHSRSRTTTIAEIEEPGTPRERALPAGTGYGFMWNLNSYWRFAERDGGVYVECQAVSLSRRIPWGLGWLIGPIVNDLPRESLAHTLAATRTGLLAGRPAR
ncbi:MAG: hypothetical protein IMZ65_00015 [Planctomycetes bacterium]|nr:hypothetical protein [Planctomycetota bacterium]